MFRIPAGIHGKDYPLNPAIHLRKTTVSDLETLFLFQLDEEGNYAAAFTDGNPGDREAYRRKWKRLLADPAVNAQTILMHNTIVGSIAKYETAGRAEVTYRIGREYRGKGLASAALKLFLTLERARPLLGRTAFDNIASQRVLLKCGFKKTGTDRGFANARGREIEEYIYRYDEV